MRRELENLPEGWFHHGEHILALLDQHRPKVCVELGSWLGASATGIIRTIRPWKGHLTCVDMWMGATEMDWLARSGHPTMLGDFAGNLIARGLASSARLIVARSDDAAVYWEGPIDFLYIDADHSLESVTHDLQLWWPHLRVGGVIAGDDYDDPKYPGVTLAWEEFERDRRQTFTRLETTGAEGRLIYGVKV